MSVFPSGTGLSFTRRSDQSAARPRLDCRLLMRRRVSLYNSCRLDRSRGRRGIGHWCPMKDGVLWQFQPSVTTFSGDFLWMHIWMLWVRDWFANSVVCGQTAGACAGAPHIPIKRRAFPSDVVTPRFSSNASPAARSTRYFMRSSGKTFRSNQLPHRPTRSQDNVKVPIAPPVRFGNSRCH